MVMVDRLLHCDLVVTETDLTVREDNIMVDDGRLSACIGALRDMEIHALPAIGSTVKTRIEVSDEVFGMTLATAESRCGDTLLASGTIKIALL